MRLYRLISDRPRREKGQELKDRELVKTAVIGGGDDWIARICCLGTTYYSTCVRNSFFVWDIQGCGVNVYETGSNGVGFRIILHCIHPQGNRASELCFEYGTQTIVAPFPNIAVINSSDWRIGQGLCISQTWVGT